MQKIGLKYYEDIKERIPRDEVTLILEKMRSVVYTLHPKGKEVMQVEACGSYRRGKLSCGDVDILITRLDGGSITGTIEKVVVALEK